MGQLINLDEVDLQQAPLPSKAVDDDDWFDSFTPTGAHQGEQDLIVLCDDLLELDTPPSTTPKHGKALSLPSSPLLSPEQALRLFEPPQYHYSPTLASVIDIKDVPLETPLVDIDDHQESSPPRRNPPATPPVPRAPLNSPSQSSSHPSSQSTQASSHCVLSVPTQPAARAPQFVPAFEPSAQSRPLEGRPGESPPPFLSLRQHFLTAHSSASPNSTPTSSVCIPLVTILSAGKLQKRESRTKQDGSPGSSHERSLGIKPHS